MTVARTAADYASRIRALLPRGRVWPVEADSGQSQVIACFGPSAARVDALAVDLVAEAFPATTTELIGEWEESLGLPDPCLGPNPTVLQQRDQIIARFANAGGQSARHFIDFAATLGFDIAITCYAPFRVGKARVGQPLRGADWAFAWLITVRSSATSVDHASFRVGQSRTGDALASTSTAAAALECELRRLAPAHTLLSFSF